LWWRLVVLVDGEGTTGRGKMFCFAPKQSDDAAPHTHVAMSERGC
jgi:hypothetical protein